MGVSRYALSSATSCATRPSALLVVSSSYAGALLSCSSGRDELGRGTETMLNSSEEASSSSIG